MVVMEEKKAKAPHTHNLIYMLELELAITKLLNYCFLYVRCFQSCVLFLDLMTRKEIVKVVPSRVIAAKSD